MIYNKKRIDNMEATKKVRIRISDLERLDDVRAIILNERKVIKSKVDTISILLDEFIEKRKNN